MNLVQFRKPFHSASALPAVTAALLAAGFVSTSQGAISTAGDLLVNIDATALPLGPVTFVPNAGTAGGVFDAGGSGASVAQVYGTGTRGLLFDGGGFLQHKDVDDGVIQSAPGGLTGPSPDMSVEAWVLNPSIPGEETIVSWGHRGGPDGSNMSLNYGYDARWGAVGRWGGPDIGWDSCCNSTGGSPPGVPGAGAWHHLVVTYDGAGSTQRIYVDGVLKNSETIVAGVNTYTLPAITIGGQLTDDASSVEPALRASMTIGRVRIHDGALTAADVANNYDFEKADFTGVAPLSAVAPLHRYRFANAAGGAPDESDVFDSIGTAHGKVQGANATFTGTRVTLPGGSSASEGYIDLPNGLLSVNSSDAPTLGSGEITLEGWTKVTGNRQWARILDFNSTDVADPGLIGGEVFGAGGGGEGLDYLFYTAQENVNTSVRNVVIRNIDPLQASGHAGGTGPEQGVGFETPNFNRDAHWAITWSENGGVVRVYENGNQVGSYGVDNVQNRFSKINDVNCWLGRSAWSGDQNIQGEYDEFRIYNKVLTDEEVARSAAAGPAQMHLPGEAPAYDKQPLSVTVQEQFVATFTVETRGAGPMTYQWYRGPNPIAGAVGQTYSLLTAASDDGALFKCVATGALGSTDSAVATLTVLADTTRPTLVGAAGGTAWGTTDSTFGVRFSEAVNEADAEDAANYTMAGYTILGPGVLQPDNITVVFGVTPSLKTATCKTLSVSNVRDRAPSENVILPGSQTPLIYAEGTIRYQRWNGPNSLGAVLPVNPDVITYVPRVENPEGNGDHGENYVAHGLMLLSPPVTGPYTFYVSSDDATQVWLSTDENPASAVMIAREPEWAGFRLFLDSTPDGSGRANANRGPANAGMNISAPVNLVAGCRYYMTFRFAEGCCGDYVSVAWAVPGGPAVVNGSEPIGAQYISPSESAPTIAANSPADQTLSEGERATITVNVTAGSPILTYQWYSNGVAVAGATGPSHQTPPLRFPDNNGDQYYVVVQNSLGSATSRTATIITIDDSTPPTLSRALAGCALDRFTLVFSEIMDEATAIDTFNYLIDGNSPGTATLGADGRTVTLLFPHMADTTYTIDVANLLDFAQNPLAPVTVAVRSCVPGCAALKFEAYTGIGGVNVTDLTGNGNFPNNPQDTRFITQGFWSRYVYPTDALENYGGRIRGLFIPRASGPHHFYLGADDGAELWLSTDTQPANRVLIARENAWSADREWTSSSGGSSVANKKSPAINLLAGEAYYIEALYKEGGGGDHCAVAVQSPDDAGPPANGTSEIPPAMLGASAPANILGPVSFPTQPQSQTVLDCSAVSFSVLATVPAPFSSFVAITYQWQRSDDGGGTWNDIPGATGTTYGFGPIATATDNGAKFRAKVCSIGLNTTSAEATLTITPDNDPPACVSARIEFADFTLDTVIVRFNEFITELSAEDTFNYSIATADAVTISTIDLLPDGMSVRINLTGPLSVGSAIDVTVENLVDACGNTMTSACTVHADAPEVRCGIATFSAYETGGGTDVALLTAHANYPNNPDFTANIGGMNTVLAGGIYANNARENYGGRVHGFFIPPTSGNWIFYIRSDDASVLALSPDTSPAGAVDIASEPGCCAGFSAHASAPQALVAGQRYYIRALYKEGGGGDYVQVAAKLDTDPTAPDSLQPIPGSQIATFVEPGSPIPTLTIDTQPSATMVCLPVTGLPVGGPTATFTVSASVVPNQAVNYQWERSSGGGPYLPIAGATSASYTFSPTLSDNGACFRAAVSTLGICGVTLSDTACLTVIQPNTPPTFTCGPNIGLPLDCGPQSIPAWATDILNDSIPHTPIVYSSDFSSAPPGSSVQGTTYIGGGVLHLTDAVNSQHGAFFTPSVGGAIIESFTVTFRLRIGPGTSCGGRPADGMSFSIGNDLVFPPPVAAEEGTGTGIKVNFDTWDNGGADEAPCLDVEVGNSATPIAFQSFVGIREGGRAAAGPFILDPATSADMTFGTGAGYADVRIHLDPDGTLDVDFKGVRLINNLPTGYIPVANARLALMGRTGGCNDEQWVDDLNIVAFTADPSLAEAAQTVQFLVSNDNPDLFSVQPAIAPDGTLTYTPAVHANGSATVTVVAKDNGGVGGPCGSQDTSAPCMFNIALNCSLTARDDGGATRMNNPITIPLSKLQRNDGDPQGNLNSMVGPITVVRVRPTSINGGTVVLGPDSVTYTPQPGFSGIDRFLYTVSDGPNIGSAYVEILVVNGSVPSQNQVALIMTPNGFLVRFAGIPGRTYELQRATSVLGPWSVLTSLTAPLHGIMEYEDTNPPQPNAFYRTVVP